MKKALYTILCCMTLTACDDMLKKSDSQETKEKEEKIYNGVRKNYLNGKLASTVTYKDSLKNGPAFNYYPDGKVNMEFHYKDNQKHGPYKWYYENGKLYQEGEYLNGKKEGVFKTYRKNGKLKSSMPWHEDNPCTGLVEYFESGNIKEVPKLIVTHNNTIKLDEQYQLNLKISDGTKNVQYYEGRLEKNGCFEGSFIPIKSKKGKGTLSFYVGRGQMIMQSIYIVAKVQTRDKNFYLLTKTVNLSIENRS
ncbi:MAG: hypothetical protein KDD41_08330 [Flavobacteriales bacterium]|nr:hypothetical protein [Flavobacteriales bacterium]